MSDEPGGLVETSLEIAVELKLGSAHLLPDVRFWVDSGFSGDLRSEAEVELELERKWCWTGTLTIDHVRPCFFYRLGISARAGVDWTLRIRDRASGRDVLVDEDRITTAKCWLLGSCDPLRPAAIAAELMPASSARWPRPADASSLVTARPNTGATVVVLADRRRHV
jgi:hypothetical protein